MNREATFWDYLRKLLPPDIHYDRIESDTSPGHPDIRYTLDGVTGTIELKSTKRPTAKYPFSGKDGLRKSQIRWIEREMRAGGFVLLALRCGNINYLLEAGVYYDELDKMALKDISRVSDFSWVSGKTPIERARNGLRAVLMSKP